MLKTQTLIILPLVLASGIFSGCTGLKKPNAVSNASAPTAKAAAANSVTAPAASTNSCAIPSVFTVDAKAQPINVAALSKMNGNFTLSSLNLFSQTKAALGPVKTVSVGASIKIGANGLRDTKLQTLCDQLPEGKGYTESLPLVMTLHLPSLRVTEFDAGDQRDVQATNNPTQATFLLNSQGELSLKNTFAEKGPYTAELSMSDWLARLPSPPSVVVLSDGSIEMRIHWIEKTSTTDSYLHFTKAEGQIESSLQATAENSQAN